MTKQLQVGDEVRMLKPRASGGSQLGQVVGVHVTPAGAHVPEKIVQVNVLFDGEEHPLGGYSAGLFESLEEEAKP